MPGKLVELGAGTDPERRRGLRDDRLGLAGEQILLEPLEPAP
jgi:hypothetical protein